MIEVHADHNMKKCLRIKDIIVFIIFAAFSFPAISGEILLAGVYQGKDLYINNPPSEGDINLFCIRNIYLNDEIILSEPESSVCRISLAHMQIGWPVHIRVEYRGRCMPVFVNPQVIRDKKELGFGEIDIDDSGIEWEMTGMDERTLFFIERRVNHQWNILHSFEEEKPAEHARYHARLTHENGLNEYRIKAITTGDMSFFSGIVRYESEGNVQSFYPRRVSGKITLMQEKNFEILDIRGNVLLRGRDTEISVEKLDPGIYYLVIDEKIEKFLKK
jgi:hypothetical protein